MYSIDDIIMLPTHGYWCGTSIWRCGYCLVYIVNILLHYYVILYGRLFATTVSSYWLLFTLYRCNNYYLNSFDLFSRKIRVHCTIAQVLLSFPLLIWSTHASNLYCCNNRFHHSSSHNKVSLSIMILALIILRSICWVAKQFSDSERIVGDVD